MTTSTGPGPKIFGRRILVLFAHPAMHKSHFNRRMVDAIRGLEGVTFRDLYEEYPDLLIDVAQEQQLLRDHQVIVFQHPFYWFSTPAILKEWQDLVLEFGFAYGQGGTALHGKKWLQVLTVGATATSYEPEGFHCFTVRELLAPMEQTAHLCGMKFLTPYVVHGPSHADASSKNDYQDYATQYRDLLIRLRDDVEFAP